jgi:anaerobic ribonucleoside-triphosphate reductase
MTKEIFEKIKRDHPEHTDFEWEGKCHDCGKETKVIYSLHVKTRELEAIYGGVVYYPEGMEKHFLKCDECYMKEKTLSNFRPCEIYSRVVGYMRPQDTWHDAKLSEFTLRKKFRKDSI